MRRSCHSLDRLAMTFDDDHAVANAGLILPATLAQHLGPHQGRGYHPLLAAVAETDEVVGCRLRGGNVHTARGAASFITKVFRRIRAAGLRDRW